jgi:hypothetical protein
MGDTDMGWDTQDILDTPYTLTGIDTSESDLLMLSPRSKMTLVSKLFSS